MAITSFPIATRTIALGQIETWKDETEAARDAAIAAAATAVTARNDAVATSYGAVLLSIASLKALTIPADGVVVRVIGRQGGFFKFNSGDLTAQVTSDPFGGIWVAPDSAATGASGAWERMIEQDTLFAEWWLPDAMPSNAHLNINSAISFLNPHGRFRLPSRTVTVSGSIKFDKGQYIDGAGHDYPINGGGGNFFPIIFSANNLKASQISSGNVAGQLVYGEAGGFHLFGGGPFWNGTNSVYNFSGTDLHAYNAETGFRAGMDVLNATNPGGTPNSSSDVTLYPSRDVYLENTTTDGIERIGIELMRPNGVQIVGGHVNLVVPASPVGFDRGVRVAAAHNVRINGLRVSSPNSDTVYGISVEAASQSGLTYGGCSDIVVDNVILEDTFFGLNVSGGLSRNIKFMNSHIMGRRNTALTIGIRLNGNGTSNGFAIEQVPHLGIDIINVRGVNLGSFINAEGHVYDVNVDNCTFISNESTAQFFLSSLATTKRLRNWRIVNCKGYTTGTRTLGTVRLLSLSSQCELFFDNNDFTPNTNMFTITGDGTIRMPSLRSNRALAASAWAAVRPPTDQASYPQGDNGLIRPAE